ncbi:MAG: formate dehydrogenase [Actinobacteria bacterium]|nr:formate dehydrogenase [Actinomycetota bacterium]
MKTYTVYVPSDSASRSVGADDVANRIEFEALKRKLHVVLIRNGTRGALWLEPLVEVETALGRVAYGPVSLFDVPSLFDSHFYSGGDHRLSLGPTDEIEWLASQDRVTFARVGITDPLSIQDFEAHGGLVGLRKAISMKDNEVIDELTASGLRGRGGAGFPAGIKWRTVLQTESEKKYICCNADEGDSGTFADRILMEGDPFTLLEGMTIAGLTVGADEGVIYVRSEYPDAIRTLERAIVIARNYGWLGKNVLSSGRAFDIRIRSGAGSYVCGEETAMLESIEGKRGVVRSKPPLPAIEGLFGKPTVINNVLTLASVPMILADGASEYQRRGVGRSLGTQVFQLAGNVARGGIVEVAFGATLGALVEGYGGGTRTGRPMKAVQIGGPLGAYLPTTMFDISMDYESLLSAGGMLGHGGIVIFDETADMVDQARFAMEFCAEESCGKCTPCRLGSTRGAELLTLISQGKDVDGNKKVLLDLCEVMTDGSLCAMGGLTPLPVKSAMLHFESDFSSKNGELR